ncbi:60S ribosomal protein L31 [Candidatus Woesearchaeota archaeon]|nr:60S ribosomal protein L31 [Candidatus Woesearchaeota archaeon]
MADKKHEAKVVLEREYNVPLRRDFMRVQRYKRANKAVKSLRDFIIKHMKSDNVSFSKFLNQKIWEKGAGRPPHHVAVIAKKYDDDKVEVEFKGEPKAKETEKKPAKSEAKPTAAKTVKEAEVVAEKKEAPKTESKPAEKPSPAAKPEPKPEAKPAQSVSVKPAAKKE